jgi:hypothetical protein
MKRSPRITHLVWGEIEVEGLPRTRDMKLWPGGGRPWDWRETATHHVPGIQVADVEELLENGARIIVLTRAWSSSCGPVPRPWSISRRAAS